MGGNAIVYKAQLRRNISSAEQKYKCALTTFENTALRDPNWENALRAKDLAALDLKTAKSRLENLGKSAGVVQHKLIIK